MENIKAYLKEVRKIPLLTAQEEIDLTKKAEKGDIASRDKMIRSNLRLVINIAKKYIYLGIPLMDLIEEGNVGLMKAVEKFNPRKGFRFSTYAAWWIRQSITRSIFDQSRTVRIPVYVNEMLTKYKKTVERLTGKLKRQPGEEDVARSMKISVDKVKKIQTYISKTSSLDAPIDDEGNSEVMDLIEDKTTATTEQEMDTFLSHERLQGVLGSINEREQEILNLRFGLTGGKIRTLAEVSKKMKVSRERIRQLEENALKKLKKLMSEQEQGKIK